MPSTTATSLTSLGTGLIPGAHGLVGYTARIPGTDRLLNHLWWDKRVDPIEWQPHPTAFARLGAAGVHVTVVNKREFEGSGLTVAAAPRCRRTSAPTGSASGSPGSYAAADTSPSLTYVYDSDLDWTGHKFGVASTQWLQQLAMVDAEAEQMREALPASTRLLVIADHGMVDSPTEARVDVDEVTGLRDGVALIGGEARFRHLYCSAGARSTTSWTPGARCWGPCDGADPRRRGRPRLVRRVDPRCCPGSATSWSPAAASRGRLDARLRLREVARRPARLAHVDRDAHPHPRGLSLAG